MAFVAKAGTALRAGRAALPRIPGPTRPWGLRPVSQPPARSGLNLPAPLNAALGGLLLCLLAGPLSAAWTWSTRSSGGDLWLTAAQDGAPLFDLRLGAGGAIAELDYRPAAGADLLANPYGDNDTDRVIQWTLWSDSYAVATPSGSEPFNEDLAGSGDGTFSPIVAVNAGPGVIDIYAVPQDQWDRSLNGAMQARYAALTRYELLPNGVLKVRRVIRTADIAGPADGGHAYDVYFEQWNPFKVGAGAFNAYALSLDAEALPASDIGGLLNEHLFEHAKDRPDEPGELAVAAFAAWREPCIDQ